jgi:hypothetical protein
MADMSSAPRRQFGTIPSPWADYAVHHFPDAAKIRRDQRQPLMDAMNAIIAINWQASEPHWTAAASPFDRTFGLILVYHSARLAAFSVYRKLQILARPAIYRSGTEVLPDHQGHGLYRFFTAEILRSSAAGESRDGGILYGWRTRNPIIWASNAKICEKVAPCLLSDARHAFLEAACAEMCSLLYPGQPLEMPDMIMRGAYGHIRHRRQAYHGAAALVDVAMSRIIPTRADALFSVGWVRS